MRHLYKAWQDKRSGWTRRVRWYAPQYESEKIRLKFEDEYGIAHAFYSTASFAQKDYDKFRKGELHSLHVIRGTN